MTDDYNPQTRPQRPLFGCARTCKFVDECDSGSECITLHPFEPIAPFIYPPYGDGGVSK